ncbi:MAG: hypothetical protein KGN36_10430 [Acidobacteriota bacterium]|nr:hypothetical protein [Acidobacteriota bacterium]
MKNAIAVLVAGTVLALSGFGAQAAAGITKKEARQLTTSAKTPEDHRKLAQYYRAEADRFDAEAKDHAAMARSYRATPTASEIKRPGASDTAAHCERLSQDLAKAAADARVLASDHEALAQKQ